MKLYAPSYYKNFKCIADKCKNSCCIGWEIDIDSASLEKYKKLKNGYGATIMDTVSIDETPHFVLREKERCPHLDENGLCKIIINEGEECLCDICREHPRFYNYTDVCEVGIGMSCEEAARVILSSPDYDVIEPIGEVDTTCDDFDFDGRKDREEIYKILKDQTLNYRGRLEKIYNKYQIEITSDSEYHNILSSLEYLDITHRDLFMNYSSENRPNSGEIDEYLERFLAYFVYRHCTEAYNPEDFCRGLSFALFCQRLFASLIYIKGAKTLDDVAELAIIISSEIEYSDDNREALTC